MRAVDLPNCLPDAAVVSVREPWASMLFSRAKTWELRRRNALALACRLAVVYVPGARGHLAGVAAFDGGLCAGPRAVWEVAGAGCGMDEAAFLAWFGDSRNVTAIEVGWAERRPAMGLAEARRLVPWFRPPQSWRRLWPDEAEALADWARG